MKEWRNIEGHDGYEVSSDGDFRRIRVLKDGSSKTIPLKKIMRGAAYVNIGGKSYNWRKIFQDVWGFEADLPKPVREGAKTIAVRRMPQD